uniref:Transporter n=1 Tax=Schmidtea mediterranea TaxID=79327 RepID=A0A0H3YF47_SCHMD|nr:slc6a-2 [Schmidtea mediterranea]
MTGIVRDKWLNKLDFLLACIGFSVGLGNVWRFPYLCYKNGGGAFLIPYFISVVLGGIPMFCLEVFVGQFMARGGIEVWNIVPLMKGIGYASVVVLFMLNCYYNVILAWAIYYLVASFNYPVSWSHCNNAWNTLQCSTDAFKNSTNSSALKIDPAIEYWEHRVLGLNKGIENVGTIKLDLMFCLLAAWIVVYFCIWKGIKTSGRVMYFTATSPYVLMITLLIRVATLPGARMGLEYYLIPKWERLLAMEVWVDSGTQIFFSYSIAIGTLVALGSYNDFHHNSVRDCVLFSVVNSGTSFLAGFVIFMTLGFMSERTGIPIQNVVASGPGLAFVVYPKALAEMPITSLWSVLFFAMIILLGIDSQFVGVEGFITSFNDIFPVWMNKGKNKQIFIAVVCLMNFGIGLTMVTHGGMYVFQLFDYYIGSRIIIIIAVLECLSICYFYGIKRFSRNLNEMFGFSLGYIPHIFWGALTPIFLLIIFIMSTIVYSELEYKRGSDNVVYKFPSWSVKVGWTMANSCLVFVPIIACIGILREGGPIIERIKKLLQPKLKGIEHFTNESHQMKPV